jgi:hypothetical protein
MKKYQEDTPTELNEEVTEPIEDTTPPPAPIEPDEPPAPEPIEVSAMKPTSRIRIFRNYGGRPTNEQRLQPGVYLVDDLQKYMNGKLAEYLVANGHAEWV